MSLRDPLFEFMMQWDLITAILKQYWNIYIKKSVSNENSKDLEFRYQGTLGQFDGLLFCMSAEQLWWQTGWQNVL